MQKRGCHLFVLVLIALTLLGATAVAQERIESMKLLTPQIGWIATKSHLYWTTTNGAEWKDITPKLNHQWQAVSSVFFLNSSMGWVVLSCADHADERADDICFEVAITNSSGETWSIVHPAIADPDPVAGFSGRTFLDFTDASHGWMILKVSRSVAVSFGVMLRTVDGGRTWEQMTKPPVIADHFTFINQKDGWLAGGPDRELYVTHNSGDSWQKVELAHPTHIAKDLSAVYDLPVFTDSARGFLPVTYVGLMSSVSPLILFESNDGGRSWSVSAALKELPEIYSWDPFPSAVVKGEVLTATVGHGNVINLLATGKVPSSSTTATIPFKAQIVTGLSFADDDHGWVSLGTRLITTTEHGGSWTEVSPVKTNDVAVTSLNTTREQTSTKSLTASTSASPIPGVTASSTSGPVITHLGFDSWPTPPIATMQAWWSSSPYYDVYIYLYGSPNKCHYGPPSKGPYICKQPWNEYAGQDWVSNTVGSGWGVIPVWYGLQSPCDKVDKMSYSTSASTAYTQGQEQAALAAAAAQGLALSGGLIYTDVEKYGKSPTMDCDSLATTYLNGFMSGITSYNSQYNTTFIVGVYAFPAAIESAVSQVDPPPAAIWVVKVPGKKGDPPSVTTLNLGVCDLYSKPSKACNPTASLWPNHQKSHQFLIDQPAVIFGGTMIDGIDDDFDDINNSWITHGDGPFLSKYSSFSSPIQIPNVQNFLDYFGVAINDMWGTAFMDGNGQVGNIAGTYDTAGIFAGSFYETSITASPSVSIIPGYKGNSSDATSVYDLNNLGQVVGLWASHTSGGAFEYAAGLVGVQKTPWIELPPVCSGTIPTLNDAGLVAFCTGLQGGEFALVIYSINTKNSSTITCTATWCAGGEEGGVVLAGINGAGKVVGAGYNGDDDETTSFIYDPATQAFTVLNPPFASSLSNIIPEGFNNNGQIIYYAYDSSTDVDYYYLYDLNSNQLISVTNSMTTCSPSVGGAGILNDFGEIVGWCSNSDGSADYGAYWMPQLPE